MKRSVAVLAFLVSVTFVLTAQRPFNFDDMMLIRRVSDPQLSPDGRTIAFVIGDVDKNANRTVNHIYTIAADQPNSIPKQFTTGSPSASAPRWSPDGKLIAFIKGGQIWLMDADGRRERQLSKISSGAGNPVWSPDGKWIAFNSDVYPECNNDQCNEAEDKRIEGSKVQAKVTERLLFRHWVEWRDRKRTHVFVIPSSGGTAVDSGRGKAGRAKASGHGAARARATDSELGRGVVRRAEGCREDEHESGAQVGSVRTSALA